MSQSYSQSRPTDDRYDVKRIIACVDGTWYNADGKEGNGTGNVSNTFRIYASVKQGTFKQNGKTVHQVPKYFHGIGVKKNFIDKHNDGMFGQGCKVLIRDVYQFCCSEVTSSNDELWLFGFSRGAYVVRAVAALFHGMRTLRKVHTDQFQKDYKEGLGLLESRQRDKTYHQNGQLYHFLREKTTEVPVIQFLGLFDTVIKTKEEIGIDISTPRSVLQVRHALAMNEERTLFPPEIYVSPYDTTSAAGSLVQAWFLGRHSDIGGGAKHDGLALYPLQWMLFESQRYNLILEYEPDQHILEQTAMEHPPKLVLPGVLSETGVLLPYRRRRPGPGASQSIAADEGEVAETMLPEWKFAIRNGVGVTMYDLRSTHQDSIARDPLEKWLQKGEMSEKATHEVRLSPPTGPTSWTLQPRSIFWTGGLRGYDRNVSYGTIIHPSVYFLQYMLPSRELSEVMKKLIEPTNAFCSELLPLGEEGWFPWTTKSRFVPKLEHVRILICGDCGVGKSTLLSRIFDICVTELRPIRASRAFQDRGFVNAEDCFGYPVFPELIFHQWDGNAGDPQSWQDLESFLTKHGPISSLQERLHAVWICNDTSIQRPRSAAVKLIAKHTPEIPVVFVGTKKDQYLHFESDLSRDETSALTAGQASLEQREADAARDEHLKVRQKGQLELQDAACVEAMRKLDTEMTFVWKGSDESLRKLMEITRDMLNASKYARSGFAAATFIARRWGSLS